MHIFEAVIRSLTRYRNLVKNYTNGTKTKNGDVEGARMGGRGGYYTLHENRQWKSARCAFNLEIPAVSA